MSEQIREQVSAFLDGELPSSETELLLKRLTRDPELRDSFGRFALIGEAMRGNPRLPQTQGFAARVNAAIDGEPLPVPAQLSGTRAPRWWRPFAGAAVVAGVAAVAVVALQHRAVGPAAAPLTASAPVRSVVVGVPASLAVPASDDRSLAAGIAEGAQSPRGEPVSYTTPTLPPGRMASYVLSHSKYSSGLGQRGVLADLLIEDEAPPAKVTPAAATAPAP